MERQVGKLAICAPILKLLNVAELLWPIERQINIFVNGFGISQYRAGVSVLVIRSGGGVSKHKQ